MRSIDEDVHVPLSRHQLSMVDNMTYKPGPQGGNAVGSAALQRSQDDG